MRSGEQREMGLRCGPSTQWGASQEPGLVLTARTVPDLMGVDRVRVYREVRWPGPGVLSNPGSRRRYFCPFNPHSYLLVMLPRSLTLTLVDHQRFLSIYVFLFEYGYRTPGTGRWPSVHRQCYISSFVDTAFISQMIIFFWTVIEFNHVIFKVCVSF